MTRPRRILEIALALALTGAAAHAAGFSFMDLGVERCGMMAVVASSDDPSAIFHNPAGLADQRGRSIYFSFLASRVQSSLRLRREDGTLTENIEPERYSGFAPFLAGTTDFGLDRFTLGAALYFPNFYGAALPADAPTRYHIIDAYFVTGFFTLSGAYRMNERWAFGAGLSYIRNEIGFSRRFDPALPDLMLEVTGTDTAVGWNAGVTWHPAKRLRVGLSYVSRNDLSIRGPLTLKDGSGHTLIETHHTTSMVIPATYRLGLNYDFGRWDIGLDYTLWDYSVYREQRTTTDVGIELTSPKSYHDAVNYAVGARLRVGDDVALVAGVQRDMSPIPDATYSLDNPNMDLWGFSAGALWDVREHTRLAIGYLHNEYDGINVRNSTTTPATNGTGDGSNDEITLEILYRF